MKEVLLHTNVSVGAAVRVEHQALALYFNLNKGNSIRCIKFTFYMSFVASRLYKFLASSQGCIIRAILFT